MSFLKKFSCYRAVEAFGVLLQQPPPINPVFLVCKFAEDKAFAKNYLVAETPHQWFYYTFGVF